MCADNVLAAWVFFAVLTWVHVWANIRALRCLVLSSLNQPRLKLLLHHYMDQVRPITPCLAGLVQALLVRHAGFIGAAAVDSGLMSACDTKEETCLHSSSHYITRNLSAI
jgi:hypothetical protein